MIDLKPHHVQVINDAIASTHGRPLIGASLEGGLAHRDAQLLTTVKAIRSHSPCVVCLCLLQQCACPDPAIHAMMLDRAPEQTSQEPDGKALHLQQFQCFHGFVIELFQGEPSAE